MSSYNQSLKTSETLHETYICEILKPLQQEITSLEYRCQYKAIAEFNERLRFLETSYADLYSKITSLEKELMQQRNFEEKCLSHSPPERDVDNNIRNNFS
jgi:hypothetical protein